MGIVVASRPPSVNLGPSVEAGYIHRLADPDQTPLLGDAGVQHRGIGRPIWARAHIWKRVPGRQHRRSRVHPVRCEKWHWRAIGTENCALFTSTLAARKASIRRATKSADPSGEERYLIVAAQFLDIIPHLDALNDNLSAYRPGYARRFHLERRTSTPFNSLAFAQSVRRER